MHVLCLVSHMNLQDVAGCARQCHEVASTMNSADLTKEAERYRWASHLMRMRLTCGSNRGAGLEGLACKAAVACARYCDILPADRVFMEAGMQVLPNLHDTFTCDVLTSARRLVQTRARLLPSASSTAFSTSVTAWVTPMPVFKWTTLISKVWRVFLSF